MAHFDRLPAWIACFQLQHQSVKNLLAQQSVQQGTRYEKRQPAFDLCRSSHRGYGASFDA